MTVAQRSARRLPGTWIHSLRTFWLLIVMFLVGLVLSELAVLWLIGQIDFPDDNSARELIRRFYLVKDAWLAFSMAMYGLFRVTSVHPVFQADYASWLRQTPWRDRLPLPLGPVHLIPQDGVVFLIVWAATIIHSSLTFHVLIACLLFPYLLVLMSSLRAAGAAAHAYFICFGLATAVLIGGPSLYASMILTGLYVVAMHGLPISLHNSIHGEPPNSSQPVRPPSMSASGSKEFNDAIGAAFSPVSPRSDYRSMSTFEALAIAWMAPWWLFAIASRIQPIEDPSKLCYLITVIALLVAALSRAVVYFGEYRPPISLLGRLLTRRWIIPGFDRALLPIACVVLWAAAVVPLVGRVPGVVGGPLLLGTGLTIALGMPPSLQEWALTGNHRIVARVPRKA